MIVDNTVDHCVCSPILHFTLCYLEVNWWEGGLRSGKRLSVPYSSLIVKFRPSFDPSRSISLTLSLSACFFIPLEFSFLIPSSRRLLQPLRKKRKINLYFCFFSCCHEKYKTSEKSYSRLSVLSSVFLFFLFIHCSSLKGYIS